jgi:cell division protein FtsI (penicillin-binding protein 3)
MTGHPLRRRRAWALVAILGAWAAIIAGRLFHLQVVESANYREEAARQHQRTLEITPPRGIIYDRNGKVLANTIKVDSVYADPREVRGAKATAEALARITGVSADELEQRLSSPKAKFAKVKRKIGSSMRAEIERLKLPGVHFSEEDWRSYPARQLAAQLIGYVNIDGAGMGGLEYRYDKLLSGVPGELVVMIDAHSRRFSRVEQAPTAGANLTLTIDESIQFIVERELQEALARTRAAGISVAAMNPRTGEILAMASYPTFNPNDVSRSKPEARKNRAVSQVYEPGSTFKILTLGAALEEKLTTPEERIDCLMGSITLFGHRINDHKPFPVLTVKEVMQYSSDVGAIKLGLRLGDDRMLAYIDRLGFGRFTGIDLPGEERGIVHPAEKWSKVSIGAVSMGQEISVTPLQILSMVSAVANGGILYRPYVVSKIEHPRDGLITQTQPSGQRVLSELTVTQLQEMLEVVVAEGTAKTSRPEGYRAAGKTGTAQKFDHAIKRYSPTKFVASFAGYAPASDPLIALIVVVDEPRGAYHGGEVAAPIFKKIVEQTLRYKSIAPDLPEYAPRYTITPPRSTDPPASIAPSAKDWAVVRNAVGGSPSGAVPAGTEDLTSGDITVPDFHGKPLRQVTEEVHKLGLRLKPTGYGRAAAQYPYAGARLNAGATVEVRFVGAP